MKKVVQKENALNSKRNEREDIKVEGKCEVFGEVEDVVGKLEKERNRKKNAESILEVIQSVVIYVRISTALRKGHFRGCKVTVIIIDIIINIIIIIIINTIAMG